MLLFPVTVFAIALSGAFTNQGKMFMPALFAVCALASAEFLWQIIKRIRKKI